MKVIDFKRIVTYVLIFLLLVNPGITALAAPDNEGTAVNAELMQFLEEEYGAENATSMLRTVTDLGLIGSNGEILNHPIYLDGKKYTLEKIRKIIADEKTDLTQMAEIDGEKISLDSLQKIIAVEKQLGTLIEAEDPTLTPEHLDQMDSLFTQALGEGIDFYDEDGNLLTGDESALMALAEDDNSVPDETETNYQDEIVVKVTNYHVNGSFTFELNKAQTEAVSFSYELIEGTLNAIKEARPKNNVITFVPGEMKKTLKLDPFGSPYKKSISDFEEGINKWLDHDKSKSFKESVWYGYARADYIHFYNYKNLDLIDFAPPPEYNAGNYESMRRPFTHSYNEGAYMSYAAVSGEGGNIRECSAKEQRWDEYEQKYRPFHTCVKGDIFSIAGNVGTYPELNTGSVILEVEAREGSYTTGQILPYRVFFNDFVIHNATVHDDPPGILQKYPWLDSWYAGHTPRLELANEGEAKPAFINLSSTFDQLPFPLFTKDNRYTSQPGAMSMVSGYQTVVQKGATKNDFKVLKSSGEGNRHIFDISKQFYKGLHLPMKWDKDFTNDPEITIVPAQSDAFGTFILDKKEYFLGDTIKATLVLDADDKRADWLINGNPTKADLSERIKVSIGDRNHGLIEMDWKLGENGLPVKPYTLEGIYEVTEESFDLIKKQNQETGRLRAKIYYNRDFDPNRKFETDGEMTDNFGMLIDTYNYLTLNEPVYIKSADLLITYPETWPSGEENKVNLVSTQPTRLGMEYPANSSYTTADQFEWTSNNKKVADILADGTIVPKDTGFVTFTLVAKNGGHQEAKVTSVEIEMDASGAAAVVVPDYASYLYVKQGNAAKVIWSTNVMDKYRQLAKEDEEPESANFTLSLYDGDFIEDELKNKTPIKVWQAPGEKELINATTFTIPKQYIENISEDSIPSYTVKIETHDPEIPSRNLTALSKIMVLSESAIVTLDKSVGQFVLDDVGNVKLAWDLKSFDMANQGEFEFKVSKNGVLLKNTVIQFDKATGKFTDDNVTEKGGHYDLKIDKVTGEKQVKDEYAITLAVKNGLESTWSYDSLYLQVYRSNALDIMIDGKAKKSYVMDNAKRIAGMTSAEILELNREITLTNDMSINSKDYNDLGALTDQIEWKSSNQDNAVINFNSNGNLADIEKRPFSSYQPSHHFLLSGLENGETTIEATHSQTGMSTKVDVTVKTLKDKLYIFQFYPKAQTTITYTNSKGEEKKVDSDAKGGLALFEEHGIVTDVYVTSKFNDTTYTGVISQEMLKTQEKNPASMELYPTNILQLRKLAEVEVFFKQPDGKPYTGEVTYRGGVYKNENYAEAAEVSGAGVTKKLEKDGKLTVIFDTTDFYSKAAGENNASTLSAEDDIEFVLEVMFEGIKYYPQVIQLSGDTNPIDMIALNEKTASLRKNTAWKEEVFMSNQSVTRNTNGAKQSILDYNGKFGPNNTFPDIKLTTEFMWWGEETTSDAYVELENDVGLLPEGQASVTMEYPFSTFKTTRHEQILNAETIWLEKAESGSFQYRLYNDLNEFKRSISSKSLLTNMIGVEDISIKDIRGELGNLRDEMNKANGGVNPARNNDKSVGESLKYMSKLKLNAGPLSMKILPTDDPSVYKTIIATSFGSMPRAENGNALGGASDIQFMQTDQSDVVPGGGDLWGMLHSTYFPSSKETYNTNKQKPSYSDNEILFGAGGYYVGEIRYNTATGNWETVVQGGGFNAGGGFEYEKNWNIKAGPVPLTFSLTVGGGAEVDFRASVLYDEIPGLAWSDKEAMSANDYLTSLRIIAYIEVFGGVGFDYSIIAAKIGVYGRVSIENTSTWLNRDYLANGSDQVLYGNKMTLEGVVGVRVVLKFLFLKFSHDFASLRYSKTWTYNNWKNIEEYWKENAHMPLTAANVDMAIAAYMEHIGEEDMHVFDSTTMEDRDYLASMDRKWYGASSQQLQSLSTDLASKPDVLQKNAYPHSNPEITQDGSIMVYLSDNNSTNVEDTVAKWSKRDASGSYGEGVALPQKQKSYGDSDLQVAGEGNLIAATWATQKNSLGLKASAELKNDDIMKMMNNTEIMVSIFDGSKWETHQLTDNKLTDLAPVVTVSGNKVLVAYRSVYATNLDNLLDFSGFDSVVYTVYDMDTKDWSDTETLYNGTNGTVMGLTAESLEDGTAAVVYTVNQGDAYQDPVAGELVGAEQEIIYSVLDMAQDTKATASTWKTKGVKKNLQVTFGDEANVNPQLTRVLFEDGVERFVLGWYASGINNEIPYQRIRLAAVDKDGEIDPGFIDSLETLTADGDVKIGPDFTFAKMSHANKDYKNLSILWKEAETEISETTVRTWDVLKATKFGKHNDEWYLSGVMEMTKMPDYTQIDWINAYVSTKDGSEVKTVLLGTEYTTDTVEIGSIEPVDGADDIPVVVSKEVSHMYSVTGTYRNAFNADQVAFNPLEIVSGFDLPIQFGVVNEGVNILDTVKIDVGGQVKTYSNLGVLPNSSRILAMPYEVPTPIEDVTYTVKATFTNGDSLQTSENITFDVPDIGVSRVKVLSEEDGKRLLSIPIYNKNDTVLKNKKRVVKVGLYTGNIRNEKERIGLYTISSEDDFDLIDQGGFLINQEVDIKRYLESQNLKEIPAEGMDIYVHSWVEDESGEEVTELDISNNMAKVTIERLATKYNRDVLLTVEQLNSFSGSSVNITIQNMLMAEQQSGNVLLQLMDKSGNVLESSYILKPYESLALKAEEIKKIGFNFDKKGETVQATFFRENPLELNTFLSEVTIQGVALDFDTSIKTYTLEAKDLEQTKITALASKRDAKVTIKDASGKIIDSNEGFVAVSRELELLPDGALNEFTIHVEPTNGSGTATEYKFAIKNTAIFKVGNQTITEVAPIADIKVQNGTDLVDVNLPSEIDVTLSDKTTEKVAVKWDNGKPTYDGKKAGTYVFEGGLDTKIGNPTNLKAKVNVVVGQRPTPPSLNIQATMMGQVVTAEQLDDSKVMVNVSGTNFMMFLKPEHFELQKAPKGLTIREVIRISPWKAQVTFAYDGTHLEQDHELGLMIKGAALTNGFNLVVNGSVQITKSANPEMEPGTNQPYKVIVKEGIFDATKVWTVKLSKEVDVSTIKDALYLTDAKGNRVPATFTSDGNNIFIQPPTGNYADGTYTLYITSKLKDKSGKVLKEPIKMTFTIKAGKKPENDEAYQVMLKEGTFQTDKDWTVNLSTEIDESTIEGALLLYDEEGKSVPVRFTSKGTTVVVHSPVDGYAKGTYTLYITSKIKDKKGKELKEPIKMIFTIGSILLNK